MNWLEFVTLALFLTIKESTLAANIQDVKLKYDTSILPGERDGIVIVQWDNGEETTICNDGFNENNAAVVCRELGYPPKGYSIAANSTKITSKVTLGGIRCKGSENSLGKCRNGYYRKQIGKCAQHKRDVHVFCLDKKIPRAKSLRVTNCKFKNEKFKINSDEGKKNSGFLQVKHNGKFHYICDTNNDLTRNSAEKICSYMCSYLSDPQIIRHYMKPNTDSAKYVTLGKKNTEYVVGWIKPSCPSYGIVSIECGDERVVPESSPTVTCTRKKMLVHWPADHLPEINNKLVKILPECNHTNSFKMKYNTTRGLDISIDLNKIKIIDTSRTDIIYTCNMIRRYNSELRSAKSVRVQCKLSKLSKKSQAIGFQRVTAIPWTKTFDIGTYMSLHKNRRFMYEMDTPYKLKRTDYSYVKVALYAPPNDVKFILKNCYITDNSKKIYLVRNGCPVRKYRVYIYPLSRTEKGFGFLPDRIIKKFKTNKLSMACEGLKCFTRSYEGCNYCYNFHREKREIRTVDEFEDVPLAFRSFNFV